MPEPKFWDEDTHSPTHGAGIADVSQTDAGATYGANEQAMLTALKAKMNSVLAALRSAGTIAQD